MSLTQAVNEELRPRLEAHGFTIVGGRPDGSWTEGAAFTRQHLGITGLLLISPEKFGGYLAVNALRTLPGGRPEPMSLRSIGLTRETLAYASNGELREAVARVAAQFEARILPWLEGAVQQADAADEVRDGS